MGLLNWVPSKIVCSLNLIATNRILYSMNTAVIKLSLEDTTPTPFIIIPLGTIIVCHTFTFFFPPPPPSLSFFFKMLSLPAASSLSQVPMVHSTGFWSLSSILPLATVLPEKLCSTAHSACSCPFSFCIFHALVRWFSFFVLLTTVHDTSVYTVCVSLEGQQFYPIHHCQVIRKMFYWAMETQYQ